MERSRLVLGLAVVFAGMTILLTVLAIVFQDILIVFLATPFAVVTYFFWYQATGRIREDIRGRHARGVGARGRGSFGAGPREDWVPPGEHRRRRRRKRAHEHYWQARQARQGHDGQGRDGQGRDGQQRARQANRVRDSGPGAADVEAYRVLGVEVGADQATVRDAYREKVKEAHPDRGGDEEAFKRVTDAYERLKQE